MKKIKEDLKRKVAREAALLLYTGQEKEYKQAKIKAAENLSVKVLPSNREVAEELDSLAQELEGEERKQRLIEMRQKALQIMKDLKDFHPKLIGSVWRGTANRKSDIDIVVFHNTPEEVIQTLKNAGYFIIQIERQTTEKKGEKKTSTHIFLETSGYKVEVVAKPLEERDKTEKCEIYGDKITGLSIEELEKILKKNPLQRFLPE
ncbi:hypothetical protein DRO54_04920 [Candidatus Bathyarchaeota archaeon]|nr:MAG: hypothetical protein DRO54_04920 [Candidatus Bathyarchaeota archaeon]